MKIATPASSFTVTSSIEIRGIAGAAASSKNTPVFLSIFSSITSSRLVLNPEVTLPSEAKRSTNTPPSDALPIRSASPAAVSSSASKLPSNTACWSASTSTAPSVPESRNVASVTTSSSNRILVSRPSVSSEPLFMVITTPP